MKMSKLFAVMQGLCLARHKLCRQMKYMVSLLVCTAMMIAYIPMIHAAKADTAEKPMLINEYALVNGAKVAQFGAVTYSAAKEGYTLDVTGSKVRAKIGDSISFEGTVAAPKGEMISWIRVDVYDALTLTPYTVGAELYRKDGMKVQSYDLANIPPLRVGKPIGRKGYTLAEGGQYIVMISVGDSNGNGFADMDTCLEEDQGPAILVDVKMSPENCRHPHSRYVYVRHSSGEIRKHSYDDGPTHQVEPLFERYCGMCDSFLMNIWGAGIPEEHVLDFNGVCLACGYYHGKPAEDEVPVDPSETEDPVDPSAAEIPVDPSETEDLVDPSAGEIPADPNEAEDPVDPNAAEIPADPNEAEDPVDPNAAEIPADPNEAEDPVDPNAAEIPADLSETEDPVDPNAAEIPVDPNAAEIPEDPNAAEVPAENSEVPAAHDTAENSGEPLNIDETNPDRKVSVNLYWGEGSLNFGDTVTMSVQLSGYEGLECSVFWQCDKGVGFETIAELDGAENFDLIVNEENVGWIWRAGVSAQVVYPQGEPAAEEAVQSAEEIGQTENPAENESSATGEAEGGDEAAE